MNENIQHKLFKKWLRFLKKKSHDGNLKSSNLNLFEIYEMTAQSQRNLKIIKFGEIGIALQLIIALIFIIIIIIIMSLIFCMMQKSCI